jgi:hypothetical protein
MGFSRRDVLKAAGSGLALLPAARLLRSPQSHPRTVASPLLPPAGTAWFGAYTRGTKNYPAFESLIGRKSAFVSEYTYWTAGQTWPSVADQQLCAPGSGRYLLLSQELRYPGGTYVTCTDVTSGKFDAQITSQAAQFAAWGQPFWYIFVHEMDTLWQRTHIYSDPAEYAAAYRHVHNLWQQAGATNAQWGWCVTGWKGNFGNYQALYPGNDVVDWIMWDPYEWDHSSWMLPAKNWNIFPSWLDAQTVIDPAKPRLLRETGVDVAHWTTPPHSAADWWNGAVEGVLAANLQGVCLFDINVGNAGGQWKIDNSPPTLAAYTQQGQSPLFNP